MIIRAQKLQTKLASFFVGQVGQYHIIVHDQRFDPLPEEVINIAFRVKSLWHVILLELALNAFEIFQSADGCVLGRLGIRFGAG